MNENDKDWNNPVFRAIYQSLAVLDYYSPNDDVVKWLNANGFCNLTVCPECHVDDFVHIEGCKINQRLETGYPSG